MSLRYIAASLGLSVTTVSRALGGYSDVAEATRQRVRAEAERIGYAPNAIARRLQKGRTDAIGVVAPTGSGAITDTYLYTAIICAWTRLSECDRDLVLLPSMDERTEAESESRAFRRAVEERRVDGLLLLRTRHDDWRLPYLRGARIPFVVFGALHEDMPDVVAIGVDNESAAEEVLDRLAEFGHRQVAVVVPEGEFAFAASRIAAFSAGVAARGLSLRVETAAFSEDGGRAATVRLLACPDHPTAIVYFANRMTFGGLHAIADTILVPGRHISLISYGDNPNLIYTSPSVTAVRAPVEDMVRHAIDVLIGEIDGKPVDPIRRWPLTLVRRQSDGPLVPRPESPPKHDRAGSAMMPVG